MSFVIDRQTDIQFAQEAMPHRMALYGVALRLTRSVHDAEDLVQDTFYKAYRAWGQYEVGTNCRAWLFRIQKNAFINKYRRRKKEREVLGGSERIAVEHFTIHPSSRTQTLNPEKFIADRYFSDEVIQAVGELSQDFRDVILQADVHGRPYKEVAANLGIPVGTVMSRLFRARRVLQKKLAEFARDEGVVRGAHPSSPEKTSGSAVQPHKVA